MNERLKESLSALLDGEVNELELQRILAHENRHEISACWQRYHNVRDLVQKESSLRIRIDVRKAVMEVINKDEPPHKA
jgi:sigma-E factor negative regulatory protein RseA